MLVEKQRNSWNTSKQQFIFPRQKLWDACGLGVISSGKLLYWSRKSVLISFCLLVYSTWQRHLMYVRTVTSEANASRLEFRRPWLFILRPSCYNTCECVWEGTRVKIYLWSDRVQTHPGMFLKTRLKRLFSQRPSKSVPACELGLIGTSSNLSWPHDGWIGISWFRL